jgi:hypothetical protein
VAAAELAVAEAPEEEMAAELAGAAQCRPSPISA